MFQNEILNGDFNNGDFKVCGIAPNVHKEQYKKLDELRIEALEKLVRDKVEQGVDKNELWKKCVKSLNRKLWKLCAKNKIQATPNEYNAEN